MQPKGICCILISVLALVALVVGYILTGMVEVCPVSA